MSTLLDRYKRAILIIGPPHSGKSVFAYLLFKYLREIGNDAALFDCDIFGPTFRSYKLLSEDEERHLYPVPNYGKLEEDVPLEIFKGYIDYPFFAVREKGIIVMDGLGKHSEKTKALLGRAECLVIVCKSELSNEEIEMCGYKTNDSLKHPFEFYSKEKPHTMKITTHRSEGSPYADLQNLQAELCGLSRNAIQDGKVVSIPRGTCEVILSIAKYIRENWF